MTVSRADILIVEDKDALRQMWRLTLERAGYGVVEAADVKQARQSLRRQPPTVVLTDLRLPDGTGLDVLRAAKALDPDTPVVVLTAYGSVEEAVAAMKDGAEDFLQKPVDPDHLLLALERLVETRQLRRACILMREEYARRYGFPRMIGDSPALQEVGRRLQQVAPTDATVLLLGESGVGKELFARAIHHLSRRRQEPFVAVNCAAIPETLVENELFGHEKGAFTGADGRQVGKFELARGGTLFLDEIGELPLIVQAKFLRALEARTITRIGGTQEISVDARIVAATNRDLAAAVAAKIFREDLFYRLAVFTLEIPPLRERREDIPALAAHFAEKYGREIRRRKLTLSPAALQALQAYDFPGNIRELENCIERACILCEGTTLEPEDLRLPTATPPTGRRRRS
ncbi:MAG: sigma-54 dependent transcriptional regulator [Chloracidobacterium sp.]|uniref:Sigma-54-dependent Fis family transcriptional regulator n=1 Tax=Chloracidobacterium validum TaxID=2821543 RepID=A0ABX8B592_9BACT|nr:sigma-54 dependent transcriptional regulator [Chloracidobacterium validum]QUW02139.1 sigma-54-dependent Fis family transcriptional regulator [Chloracidobacterium validum]